MHRHPAPLPSRSPYPPCTPLTAPLGVSPHATAPAYPHVASDLDPERPHTMSTCLATDQTVAFLALHTFPGALIDTGRQPARD